MATTLPCRLLCASRVAYAVSTNASSSIPACPPYDDAIGFTAGPIGFVSGPSGIDACLVGTNGDGVIVALRGTLPPDSPNHEQTFEDWLNDIDAVLVPKVGIQGKVHQGFWNALDALWPALFAETQKQLATTPGKPLYVTGHSKGGAMASLAAVRFALAGVSSTVCTLASAHPGNTAFAKFFDTLGMIASATRYEYADDIVPHLPPGLALRHAFATIDKFKQFSDELITKAADDIDYAPVGVLRFIDWNGSVIGDSPTLPISRAFHLAELVAQLRFDQIVHDHTIDCAGGYAGAICPIGVCP
jgi:hypothetical protein